ncbi:MAG: peptidylprolyl isomerase [Bacteroidales bacterium]|nr:peptidylprolyl isomerase [Bacteroidales bacterium]
MKQLFLYIIVPALFITVMPVQSQEQTKDQIIVIETQYGNIEILLYDKTPLHRDNMIKLIKSGFYNDLLFHRVINNFMIQGGDPASKGASKGVRLGSGGPGYTIPAEIEPSLFHKKGALAAARKGDNVNPQRESSGSQFYIVQGQLFSEEQLAMMQSGEHHTPFTPEQIKAYTTIGGTPHLDGAYTVFGEVINGLEVVDRIASLPTDPYDRPLENVTYSIGLK